MTPDEIKANLTAEQWERYEGIKNATDSYLFIDERKALEDVAERNRLIAKHQWGRYDDVAPKGFCCYECGQKESNGHTPDCAIAAALKGIKPDISWEEGVGE